MLLRSFWILLVAPPDAYDGNSRVGRSDVSRVPGMNAPGFGVFEEDPLEKKPLVEAIKPFPLAGGGLGSSTSDTNARRSDVSVMILASSANSSSSRIIGAAAVAPTVSKIFENFCEKEFFLLFDGRPLFVTFDAGDKEGVGRGIGVAGFLVR